LLADELAANMQGPIFGKLDISRIATKKLFVPGFPKERLGFEALPPAASQKKKFWQAEPESIGLPSLAWEPAGGFPPEVS
jgi:hypothetical protein